MGVGEMGVGEMGVGETGVGEMALTLLERLVWTSDPSDRTRKCLK